jgi:hypothetical protein
LAAADTLPAVAREAIDRVAACQRSSRPAGWALQRAEADTLARLLVERGDLRRELFFALPDRVLVQATDASPLLAVFGDTIALGDVLRVTGWPSPAVLKAAIEQAQRSTEEFFASLIVQHVRDPRSARRGSPGDGGAPHADMARAPVIALGDVLGVTGWLSPAVLKAAIERAQRSTEELFALLSCNTYAIPDRLGEVLLEMAAPRTRTWPEPASSCASPRATGMSGATSCSRQTLVGAPPPSSPDAAEPHRRQRCHASGVRLPLSR